jgi:hypothetical protein
MTLRFLNNTFKGTTIERPKIVQRLRDVIYKRPLYLIVVENETIVRSTEDLEKEEIDEKKFRARTRKYSAEKFFFKSL